MGVVDTLVTRFAADTRDYEAGARRVTGSTREVDMATKGAGLSMMNLVGAARMAAQAYALVNGAIIAVGVASYRKFAEFDALQKSLEAVEGNAKNAAAAMKMLRDVAKLPGLGLVEAAEGYRGLRLQGLDSGQSERVIRAAGNANALSGGGREELNRILVAIRQILSRPNLSGEELNQLAEANIPAHRILIDAFGTADGGELKKMGVDSREALEAIVQGLEKMPKAGESAKNAIENLQQAAELAVIAIGSGVATGGLPGALSQITAALEELDANGGLKIIGEAIAGVMNSLNPFRDSADGLKDVIIELAAYTYGTVKTIEAMNEAIRNLGTQIWDFIAGFASTFGIDISKGQGNGLFGAAGGFLTSVQGFADEFRSMLSEATGGAAGSAGSNSLTSGGSGASGSIMNAMAGLAFGAALSSAERGAANPQLQYLRNIDRNTRETADMTRMILGGGNMGRFGVTATDLSEIRSSPHGSPANPGFARWTGFGVPGLARR